ncbi:hypothetical protein HMPREF1433_00993 [Helicobacter pylori GAMchJs117Ai]|nr:hypothetical protein HMPREF1405_00942 [Helicobacter pylori GAM231Ai]EMJ40020.1 hypothetical protein HMPREF1433_00993 [Helicobacter pylori GAMchJs117Ai]
MSVFYPQKSLCKQATISYFRGVKRGRMISKHPYPLKEMGLK